MCGRKQVTKRKQFTIVLEVLNKLMSMDTNNNYYHDLFFNELIKN